MEQQSWLSFCFLVFVFASIKSEDILFPGNVRFPTVAESDVENAGEYVDPMNTGSHLFDSQATPSTPNKLLGYNIPVRAYVSGQTRYFRAHPTFMKCAQQTIMKLKRAAVSVDIVSGYRPASVEPADSTVSSYLRSGCAIQLGIREGGNGTIDDIAAAVLQTCPVIVEKGYVCQIPYGGAGSNSAQSLHVQREHRDLALVLMSDRVHFHMSGPDSDGPLYQLDPAYSGAITDLDTWVQEQINKGLEPDANPTCDLFSALTNGDHYPAGKDQLQMFGTVDVRITRNMTVDFGRLVQYQGSSIVFENSEGASSWCGEEGHPCPQCYGKNQGNSLSNRCADRVMTQRLLTLLNKLQRKVRIAMNDKLKVTDAWYESHSADPEGDLGADQLHYEGRAAKVQLVSDNSETNIGVLSKYAICLGADYLEHRGSYLYVAVKRAQTDPVKVTFPSIELLSVDPPTSMDSLYSLPKEFPDSVARQYPLFDSKGRLDTPIASSATIGQFVSPTYPYFRISPKIVECYSDIVYHENKRRKDGDPEIKVEITRGYLTNVQNQRKFDIIKDERANKHNLGVAMQLRYKPNATLPGTHTPYRLLYTVIHKCAPRFSSINQQMGVGLYSDSVYVDIRKTFHLMEESLEHLPEGVNRDTFEDDIHERYLLAKDRRIVDPDNYETACLFARKPEPQSCGFQHEHSEGVKRRRRRRETNSNTNDCVPTRYTVFCSSTVEHRNDVVKEIKSMLDRKHYACRSKEEIEEALIGCFGDCGTCMTGEVFESKQEHCNNLLHWVDWLLMNRDPDITNFFLRSNENARVHACENGADCIENAPLFSLIAPSVEKIYRPDPKQSVEEELYSSVNNPLPVYQLLDDIYAIQASGLVKFWIKDDSEMTALKRPLEIVMLYNKNVTKIEIYVERYEISQQAVRRIVETAALEMTINGCPDVTRETLTPYDVLSVPQEYRKRAAEPPSLRRQVREYHKNYEARWAERNILI